MDSITNKYKGRNFSIRNKIDSQRKERSQKKKKKIQVVCKIRCRNFSRFMNKKKIKLKLRKKDANRKFKRVPRKLTIKMQNTPNLKVDRNFNFELLHRALDSVSNSK